MEFSTQEPAFVALSKLSEPSAFPRGDISIDKSKLIAFYLPQYHRIKENSEWWGPGFTEWTNVVKGRPNFSGHYQPHIPRELGFYDLSNPEILREQAELAKQFGIHGFCFYYYWFSGRKILERPLENFLKSDIDISFCYCWANENWTRTWDGDTKSVLMSQEYLSGDAERFFQSLLDVFKDPRYILVDGKPMLVVYRAKDIPETKATFNKWRSLAKDAGFKGLHIVVVDFYDISTPFEVGADALVEFPPHKFNSPQSQPNNIPEITNPKFFGGLVDYAKVIAQSTKRSVPNFKLYRGILPSWDNTARRQDTPTILVNSAPDSFGEWLSYLRAYTRQNLTSDFDNFIFINAWNEWGEGCHLEPDQKWGMQFLEQIVKSSYYVEEPINMEQLRQDVLRRVSQQISGRLAGEGQLYPTGQMASELIAFRPSSNVVHNISAKLKRWPVVHRIARSLYRLGKAIGR